MDLQNIDIVLKRFEEISDNFDTDLIRKAYILAEQSHQGQYRKSGEPYIIHPLEVSIILADIFKDTSLVVAALLHDVLEDTDITFEDIKEKFGEDIAFLVEGVTKLQSFENGKVVTKSEKDRINLNKLLLATAKDARVMLIKLADRLHNMRTIKSHTPYKQKEIAIETLTIFAPIAKILGIKKIQAELEDLSFKVLNFAEYKKIADFIAQKKKEREKIIDQIISEVSYYLSKNKISHRIFGRSKHFYSIFKKREKKKVTYYDINDLLAIRIIVKKEEECYLASSIVHSLYSKIRADKDYIRKPKENGYQSLHILVKDSKNNKIEFQIRTEEMDEYAEIGRAAHLVYKMGKHYNDHRIKKVGKGSFELDLFSDNIFVFTPNREIKQLPVNSTPIDFAFEIHSELGLHTKEAKINGKLVPLKTKLKNADTVEIISSKKINCSRDWLNFVASKKAKSKIKSYFRKKMAQEAIELGKEIFFKKARKFHIPHKDDDEIIKFARNYGFYNLFDFYYAIGKGKFVLKQSDLNIVKKRTKTSSQPQKIQNGNINLGEINNLMINFAKCCNPKPNDEIVGYITRGRGLSIHKKDCKNPGFRSILNKEKERIIDVNWGAFKNSDRKKYLKIKFKIKKSNELEKLEIFLKDKSYPYIIKRIRKKRNVSIYQVVIMQISETEFLKLKEKLKETFPDKFIG